MDASPVLLIYGAAGYVGSLLARAAVASGLRPVLAGRDAASVSALGRELGLPVRVFPLADAGRVAAELAGVTVVVNCAGPFARTMPVLLQACLQARVHYLDVAGEVDEHLQALAQHEALAAAGVMAMPGVGFGVVPTELLAARAVELLPGAEELTIVYDARGGASRGTLATVLPSIHRAGLQRRAGELVPAMPGCRRLVVDLGDGPVTVVTNPWRADLVSAHASTGVATISTFASFPLAARLLMRMGRMLDRRAGRALVDAMVRGAAVGPDEAARRKGWTACMVEASVGTGAAVRKSVRVFLRGPEAYAFTIDTALEIARRVLHGAARPGFRTPSQVFGSSLLDALPGVSVRVESSHA